MARRRARRDREYWRSQPTAAQVARDRRLALSTALLKPACSGCLTKIIRHSGASKSILISASTVKNALVTDQTARLWIAVPGTRSRWYPTRIGMQCTALRYLTYRPLHILL